MLQKNFAFIFYVIHALFEHFSFNIQPLTFNFFILFVEQQFFASMVVVLRD